MADEIACVMVSLWRAELIPASLMAMRFSPSTLTGLFGANSGGIPAADGGSAFLFCILLVVLIGGVTLWLHAAVVVSEKRFSDHFAKNAEKFERSQ